MLFSRSVLPFIHQVEDQLPEQRVLPCEPRARELVRVVHIERFVHEARPGVGRHQHFDTAFDLRVVRRGESLHHDAHRPGHVVTDMRSSDALARRTAEEIGIRRAPHEAAGVLINRVLHVHIAQIRHGQQTRNVRVVHQEAVAVAVNLESIDFTEIRMVADRHTSGAPSRPPRQEPYIRRPVSSPRSPSSGFRTPCAATLQRKSSREPGTETS